MRPNQMVNEGNSRVRGPGTEVRAARHYHRQQLSATQEE